MVSRDRAASTDKIIAAALDTLMHHGLTDWTIEQVAATASCAKGLVLYHFKTKNDLLFRVATEVAEDRLKRRISALSVGGTEAIDRLWEVLSDDVRRGVFGLWLSLVSSGRSRGPASITSDHRQRLSDQTRRSFPVTNGDSLLDLHDILTGFELALLQGRDREAVRESYDRYWLDLLSRHP